MKGPKGTGLLTDRIHPVSLALTSVKSASKDPSRKDLKFILKTVSKPDRVKCF